ncbi:MAG TPA: tetratricopeptide repeat protein, partial [Candidatus Brocadiales bacterium]|nr:tetratricopeptide repeat protein [Candidatus Brocadiales bacterium]
KVIEIHPQYAGTWHNKGIALLKIGKVEEASKSFANAHGIDLNEYKYWMGWITSLYEEGKLDRSLNLCDKGIAYFRGKDEGLKNDALKELFYQKGVILTKQGKSDEGLRAFREASKLGNKQAQQAINQLIDTKAGWWEWWFSGIFKGLLGGVLVVTLIAMLILPIISIFSYSQGILKGDFSNLWQIWIAGIVVLIFTLFHRNIVRIKTPFGGEIEMPGLKAAEISMPEIKPEQV